MMARLLYLSTRLSTLSFLLLSILYPALTLARSDSSEISSSKLRALSYSARVNSAGNQIYFPDVSIKTAKEQGLSPRLRLTFRTGTLFSPESVRLALNGLRACYRPGRLPAEGTWETSAQGPVLVLDLSDLDFDKLGFYDRVEWIQRFRGQLRLWVIAPSRVRTATLDFVRLPPSAKIPVVVLESVDPKGWLKTSSTVRFSFKANAPSSGFECAMDSEAFTACRSPYVRSGLRNGSHLFRARALALDGRRGSAKKLDFYIWAQPPGIVIDDINPNESPTSERTMAIKFHKVGTLASWAQAQCSLDNGPYKACASPVRYSNLGDGAHSVSIRRVDPFLFGITLYAEPAVHRWMIENKTPTLSWLQTPPTPTASSTATFAFAADLEVRFLCSLDGASPSACTSPFELRDLAEGEHELTVSADGVAATSLSHRWMVDRTAPELQFTSVVPQQNPSSIDTLNASYSSTEPLASVRCSLDGQSLSACASPIRLTALPEGNHVLVVDGMDASGNRSTPIQYAWSIDRTYPTLTIQALSPTQFPTQSQTARFRFVPSEASTFTCALNGSIAAACAMEATFANLEEGFHRLTVTAIDAAGNTSEPVWFEWQVDRTAPVLALGNVEPPESPTASTSRSIAFNSDEAMTVFTCDLDAAGAASCASPYLANGLADGNHRLVVRGRDLAGNVSAPLYVDWVVSTVAYVTLGAIEPAVSPTSSRLVRFEFSSAQSADFVCSLDGATASTCYSPATFGGLADGEHTFSVQARNALAVPGPVVLYRWVIDGTAPVVTLGSTTPSWSPTASGSFSQSFSASEPASFLCRLDAAPTESSCASPMRYDNLTDGDHTFSVVAVDASGNRSPAATRSWRIDTTPIVVSNFSVSNVMRNTAVISWTTDRPTNGRVEYGQGSTLPPSPQVTAQTALGTNHSVTLTGLAANTLYTVRAVAVDLDGRSATSVPPQTFRTNR